MVRALALSLIFFAALGAVGALFVARRVLQRIDDMNTSAHGIMAGDLTRRLPVSGSGDELDRLAEGLNEMLGRIAELMEGLREVSDNIAHDLRTPLTRLRNHAEAALAFGGDAASYRLALEKTIEESDALIKIFNALLLIARAEAGGDVGPPQLVDVGEAARSVAELYEPIAEEEGVALTVRVQGPLTVQRQSRAHRPGDRQSHRQRAQIRRAGSRVRRCRGETRRRHSGRANRRIRRSHDRRPRARALRPPTGRGFSTGSSGSKARARGPGRGLGLSLAAAVARMHGGSVELEDNEPGLRVRLTLPAADPSRPCRLRRRPGHE